VTEPASLRRDILTTLMPGFAGATLPGPLRARLADGLGSVCIFGPNVVSPAQLRALNQEILAANPHAVITIDEEGGDVTRLDHAAGSAYPGNAVLGRIDEPALTRDVAASIGRDLLRVGCTLDFAPDVDVNSNPDNPVIGVRSFGSAAELVARHGASYVAGLQSTGVAACAKHFPGHGDTAQDSHLALPVVDRSLDELWERELVPFRAAIAAGVRTIMTSHIVLPQVDPSGPATFSPRILQELLRGELGFDGVIVSDALDMKGASGEVGIPEAAARALAAGCDLLCLGTVTPDTLIDEVVDAVHAAIASGWLGAARVADAARRVLALAGPDAPTRSGGREAVPLDRVIAAFDVKPGALEALRETEAACGRPFAVLRLVVEANIAVGAAPWGPFAQAAAEPDDALSVAWARHPLVEVSERDAADGALEAALARVLEATSDGRAVVVIGQAVHRHPFAADAVDRLRALRPTVVVDMGWPSDDRRYADVATFGASRLVGAALIALLV
jgi:beta-N-acetylhexosaminidase